MGNLATIQITKSGDKPMSTRTLLGIVVGNAWGQGAMTVVAYTLNSKYVNSFLPKGGGRSGLDWNTILNTFHSGGINVLRADGSVQFVIDSVNLPTLKVMCVWDDDQQGRIQ